MLSAIYKSSKRDQTYLFIEKKEDFSRVPEALLQSFGTPQFVMLLALEKRDKLAGADIHRVRQELAEKGFYLQVPPPVESLLTLPQGSPSE